MSDIDSRERLRQLVVSRRSGAPYDVYIGRNGQGWSSCFGNPFPIVAGNPNATRTAVVAQLETLLLEGQTEQARAMRLNLSRLNGKRLACFCAPALCHGHVLAHHAASLEPGEELPIGGKLPRLIPPWKHLEPQPHPSVEARTIGYARYPVPGMPSLEVSSQGDKRFSALFAKLSDGRTLECAYQLDVKGYRIEGDDWRLGKGKPPLRDVNLWVEYRKLWDQWVDENPQAFADLARLAEGRILTDKFASSPISQARALAEILSERLGWRLSTTAGAEPARVAPKLPVKEEPARQSAQTDLFGDAAPPSSARLGCQRP